MPTNSGNPVDSAGNLQVDFAWGNFPPQPNDVRTLASDTTTPTATTDPVYSTTNTNKRLIPGKDNHDAVLGGWGGYPLFSAGSKTGNFYQGDTGKFATVQNANGTLLSSYTPYIVVPSITGQTDLNAKDALRDSGFANSSISNATAALGGRWKATGWTTSGQNVTYTGGGNSGFSVGDIFTVWNLGATLNGTYTAGSSTATTSVGAQALLGTPAATSTGTGYLVVVGQSLTTTATAALGATDIVVASATNLTVGMVATAVGVPTGAVIQSINGTTVKLSAQLTAALSATSVTFKTAARVASGIRTLSSDGTTVTVNTTATHGLVVGDSVTVINSAVKTAQLGTGAASQAVLNLAAAGGNAQNDQVFGPGIPAGATITATGAGTTTPTISSNLTATLVANSVSTTGTGTAGSTALTVASGTNTVNGQFVTGYGIPANTYVSSGGGTTSIVLSNALNVTISASAVTFTIGATTSASAAVGATVVNVASTTNLVVGQTISGTGIVAGTVLVAINTLALTLSQPTVGAVPASTLLSFTNLITIGLQSNGVVNTGVSSSLPVAVLVTSVPNSSSFTFAGAGVQAGSVATTTLASDTYWATTTGSSNTSGQNVLNLTSGQGAFVNAQIGSVVTGTGIDDGTVVLSRSTDAITLSKNLTATITAGTVIGFSNGQVVPGVRTNTVSAQGIAAGAATTGSSTAITVTVYN
jgi:hypothetical protein